MKRLSWAGHVADMSFGEIRRQFWWGKPDKMNPRREWDDDIKLYIKEIVWESLGWIHVAEGKGQWRCFKKMIMKL